MSKVQRLSSFGEGGKGGIRSFSAGDLLWGRPSICSEEASSAPGFSDLLQRGVSARPNAFIMRQGWAIVPSKMWRSNEQVLVAGEESILKKDRSVFAEQTFPLGAAFDLTVIKGGVEEMVCYSSPQDFLREIGGALAQEQMRYYVSYFDLLNAFLKTRTAAGKALSQVSVVRHQVGEIKRRIHFLEAWIAQLFSDEKTFSSVSLIQEICALGRALGRLAGGRGFLSGGPLEAVLMYRVLSLLYLGETFACV